MVDCDIIDDSPPRPSRPAPSTEELREALAAQLTGRDLAQLSLKGLRRELEQRLGFAEGGLDGRRDELKALAQAFAQAAAARVAAPPPVVTPAQAAPAAAGVAIPPSGVAEVALAGKRRKSLLAGPAAAAAVPAGAASPAATAPATTAPIAGAGLGLAVVPNASMAEAAVPPAAMPAAKRKMPSTSYSLWCADNRARIMQELQDAMSGAKPSFAESAKAMGDAWKEVPAEAKAPYEQRVVEARAAEPLAPKAPKVAGGGRGGGRGAGRGKGGGKGQPPPECRLTRAEFLGAKVALQSTICLPPVSGGAEAQPPMQLASMVSQPRLFKSGSSGWFGCQEFVFSLGGKEIKARAQVNIMLPSSKYWEDGEGLEAFTAGTAAQADCVDPEAEGGAPAPNSEVKAAVAPEAPEGTAELSDASAAQAGA